MSLKRFNIIKFNDNKNNDNNSLFILRNKFYTLKYQLKQTQIQNKFTKIKLIILTTQLNDIIIVNI